MSIEQRGTVHSPRPERAKVPRFDETDKSGTPAQSAPEPQIETPATVEIQLAGWTITIDNDGDAERIAKHEWKVGTFGGVERIYKELPVPQLLTGFLLGVDPTVFVEIQKPWSYNPSKKNLFIYRPKVKA